jgi:hypothetical protein
MRLLHIGQKNVCQKSKKLRPCITEFAEKGRAIFLCGLCALCGESESLFGCGRRAALWDLSWALTPES